MKTNSDSKTANVLLVDDNQRNLDALECILACPELHLMRASTPDEALLWLVNEEFACIVLDVQMPGMNGFELANLIKSRKRSRHTPIIFITAYLLEERDILQGYGAGAVDYLTKPINPRVLKSKVSVFVDLFLTTRALASANATLETEVGQRKKAEDALRVINNELEASGQKSQSQLAAIVESSDDAIISKDLNGIIASWNKGAERLFGYTAEEVVGKSITVLIPAERSSEELDILSRIRRGEYVRHYETVRRRKDGTLLDISLTISPIRDAEGKVIGASKIARDITDRKRIEKELKRAHHDLMAASRAKDNFLATLSHELRTPLNPVLLLASENVRNRDIPDELRGDFEIILKNIEMEARLIDDLLDLTRIARGKILLDKKPVDIHRVLRDAIATVQEELDQKRLELVVKLSETRCTALADATRLQQVFWNVLRNAVKFTPHDGQIRIQTEVRAHPERRSNLAICVSDTGMGMTPIEIERLFTAFSQPDNSADSATHRLGGLGLGLSISQKLVELHNGRIGGSSPGRDQGSTFTIELPLMETGAKSAEPGVESGGPNSDLPGPMPRALRVLVVEDHEPTRAALVKMLARRDHRVVAASSLAEARAVAGVENFDLVISDLGLPDGTGYELMTELKRRGPAIGIALTGYGMADDIVRSREAGFMAHLTKPVHAQSLESALHTAARCIQPAAA